MAHELGHVRNRDTLVMTMTATIAGAISMLANFGFFFRGGEPRQPAGDDRGPPPRAVRGDAGPARDQPNPRIWRRPRRRRDLRRSRAPSPRRSPSSTRAPPGSRARWRCATRPRPRSTSCRRAAAATASSRPIPTPPTGSPRSRRWPASSRRRARGDGGAAQPAAPAPAPSTRSAGATGEPAPDPAGVPARRAALSLLDAVLRKGLPLEAALDTAARGLAPNDRGLAHAIAAETLRRLRRSRRADRRRHPQPAPRRRQGPLRAPHRARPGAGAGHSAPCRDLDRPAAGRRRAAQARPRRLRHPDAAEGGASRLCRRCRAAVEARWTRHWGEDVAVEAARLLAAPPPLDLCFAAGSRASGRRWRAISLMPGHLRLPARAAVAGLTGYGEGGWWVQDIAASLPARLLGAGRGPDRARPVRRSGRQDDAAGQRRLRGDRRRLPRKVVSHDFPRIWPAPT